MSRDPRKNSAFDSGMRGRETPKVQASHGATMAGEGKGGGENKQGANTMVGNSGGESAYSSGMRGGEKPKGNKAAGGSGGGENKQGANTTVGNPNGEDTSTKVGKSMDDGALQSHTNDQKKMGIAGNNTEMAVDHVAPEAEEDEENLYFKVPKASLKRKAGGLGAA